MSEDKKKSRSWRQVWLMTPIWLPLMWLSLDHGVSIALAVMQYINAVPS
ncbi:hypothetical protein OG851_43045 (plasmid) [Streptomyces sp. NBC_00161]